MVNDSLERTDERRAQRLEDQVTSMLFFSHPPHWCPQSDDAVYECIEGLPSGRSTTKRSQARTLRFPNLEP